MPAKSRDRSKKLTREDARALKVKIGFLEGLIRRDPAYVEALQVLGDHYTQCGRFDQGLEVDKKLSRLEPRNPLVFYNLACSHSLKGQFKLATAALETALDLGYSDFKWLARDPDLRRLRKHSGFAKIAEKIQRLKPRVS